MNFPGLEFAPGLPTRPDGEGVLTPESLEFLGELVERFAPRVEQILRAREQRQARLDAGEMPDFLAETRAIREGDWKVAPIPADLQDLLAQWRHRPPSRFDFTVDLETFLPPSYHYILYGMGFETRLAGGIGRYPGGQEARAAFARVAGASGAAVSHLPDHRALLDHLRGRQPSARVS